MIRTIQALALVVVVFLAGCSPPAPHASPTSAPLAITLYNSPDTTTIVTATTQGYRMVQPQTQFTIAPRETGQITPTTPGYTFSHHLPPGGSSWAVPLAQDALVLVAHPQNPISSLTPDDIRRLYQGIITNWQALGGSNIPVILYSREEGSSLRAEFDRLVMGQRRISPNARVIPSSTAALERIQSQPGAIAYIALSQLPANTPAFSVGAVPPTRQSVADQRYPLRMTVFIISEREPPAADLPFILWLQSPDGQAIIGQTYIPQLR